MSQGATRNDNGDHGGKSDLPKVDLSQVAAGLEKRLPEYVLRYSGVESVIREEREGRRSVRNPAG
jgi:hypothetical protein